MSEMTRTGGFLAAAVISAVLASVFAPETELKPTELAGAKLGEEFYADFKNPNDATGVTVVTFDEAQGKPKAFSVEFKDGIWTIPSHHSYPADGAERLAKTAASAIGIKRDEVRSSSSEDYVELGVVDPLDADVAKLKGRGQRITLKKGETVLCDLIIGKGVKNRTGYYYVRKPDEKSTYVAKLDIDVSTKFADWVETDLLKVDRDDLRELTMNNYSIDESRGAIVDGDVVKLARDKAADPWKLADLKEATEEFQTARVNDVVNTLDDLRLVGIRKKPAGLSEDLKLAQGISLDQLTALDLQQKGFFVTREGLRSNEGEFVAATEKGVVYTLRFGEIFTGDDLELEAGIKTGDAKADAKDSENKANTPEGEKQEGDQTLAEGPKANRYLFVTAHFDPKYLGPKPVAPSPVAPKTETPEAAKPEEAKPAEPKPEEKPAEEKPAEEKPAEAKPAEEKPAEKAEEKPAAEKPAEETKPEEKPESARVMRDESRLLASVDPAQVLLAQADEAKPEAEKAEDAKPAATEAPAAPKADEAVPEPLARPKDDKAKPAAAAPAAPKSPEEAAYQAAMKQYEADLKAYEEKVKAGEAKVKELNARFADWYYVISAESYNKLHVARKDVVKEKTPVVDPSQPAEPAPALESPAPEAPAGDKPATEKPAEPAAEKTPAEEPKTEEKPKAETPAEEKPAEPKAEEKPAEEKPADAPKEAPKPE
jgi:hypothetical protein